MVNEQNCTHDCGSCSANCESRTKEIEKLSLPRDSKIKKVIGVSSGKGGVGKSFISGMLAVGLAKQGYKVGILDGDILGPSIPMEFGIVNDGILATEDNLMLPKESRLGIKIISANLLLEQETTPIIYRGALIANILQQFWTDVLWGELDYLIIDMPPGTGDVALTIYQSIPIDGVMLCTSPQSLVSMIVEKSVNMAKKMNIPILGLIENMSYVKCPHCSEKIYAFGKSNVEEVCSENGIELLAKLALDSAYSEKVDMGRIEELEIEELNNAIDKLIALMA